MAHHAIYQELPNEFIQLQASTNIPDNILEYVTFQSNCCRSYQIPIDPRANLLKSTAQIQARKTDEVRASALAGNPSDYLELGLRMWTGCSAEQDGDGAMIWWGKIADPLHPERPPYVSRHIQTRALSCLASACRERSYMGRDALQIDHLYRAGKLADMAGALGFMSPNMLGIAGRIEEVGLRRQADCRFEGVDTTRYEKLDFLWRAYDAHRARISSKDRQRDTKATKAPNLYQCAAEGCGIEATSKSGLSKCSGPCLADVKPSYCCKECQRADWKRHKKLCKANAEARLMQPMPSSNDSTCGMIGEKLIDKGKEPMIERNDGKELIIEVSAPGRPGGKMKIASTTLSPASLKEMRNYLEKDV